VFNTINQGAINMTALRVTLHQSPEAFTAEALITQSEELFRQYNELLELLREATDIPAMEETRQQIRAARTATKDAATHLRLAQVVLEGWENAIINRTYNLTKESAA
jgi:hypothetical protein